MTLVHGGELGSAIGASPRRPGIGLPAGTSAGIALALVSGLSRIGGDIVDAPVQMLRTVPFAASSRCSSPGSVPGRRRRSR